MENKLKIKSINIYNFKSIWKSENIDITGGIIPILGMNGAGKSNILKAIDWFRNGGYEESILNFYREGTPWTKVSFNIGINFKNNTHSAFNETNKSIIKKFTKNLKEETVEKISLISTLNAAKAVAEYDSFIHELLERKEVKVIRYRKEIKNGNNIEFYSLENLPTFGLSNESEDYMKIVNIISEYINKFLIQEHFPKIKIYKTSETLNDFNNSKSKENGLVTNTVSFVNLFKGISLKNETMPNYKLIDNMIKSMNHEEIDSLATFSILASKEFVNGGNIHDESKFKITLKKFQELFSQWINGNAFFKSINTNMTFMIYPEIVNGTEVKLTMYDIVDIDGKDQKKYKVDNITKKNDGFIFALLLFFDIEFSHTDETIILIDEPANFLSTNSIRLLMESFKRSKKQKSIKFIFTTHSSNTLDKNIVNLKDILIATKGKDHSTNILKACEMEVDSPEWEVIHDEYKIPRRGIDIIATESNYLVTAENAFEKDFYKIVDTLIEGNIIPLVDIKILKNNIAIIEKMNSSFINGKYDEKYSEKINVVELLDEYEISKVAYELDIMGGDASPIKMKNENDFKIMWITRILRHFENDINGLKENMPESIERIKRRFINE